MEFISFNKELYAQHSSPNIIRVITSRRMRWMGHITYMRDRKGAYRVLVGRPDGKRPLGRPRLRWEDIKMNHQKMDGEIGLIMLGIGTGGGCLRTE